LAKTLFSYTKFNLIFSLLFVCWCVTHFWLLHDVFKFSWVISIWDSFVYNSLLAACAVFISLILFFYKPVNKSLYTSLSTVVIITILWAYASKYVVNFLNTNDSTYLNFVNQSTPIRMIFGLMINIASLGISWFWYGIEEQKEQAKRRQTLEDLAKEAELLSLRQKLQPHFLFNSLNSISALIVVKPDLARTMIHQLSDFLRSTLKQEENKKISIEEELEQLELYLSIEKVRFGHRLQTVVTRDNTLDAQVPAMLLQPIVENAIKFGLYDITGDVLIQIDVRKENDQLCIAVRNPFDQETRNANDKGTGFGLNSIKRRLYLLYSRTDLLQTFEEEGIFITKLCIPQ